MAPEPDDRDPVGGADLGDHAKVRAAFELSPTILCVTRMADGRIREVNDAFLRTTGYDRGEILGRTIEELGLWIDPEQRERGRDELRRVGTVRDVEARFRVKDGTERVCVLAAGIVDIGGEPCVVTAVTDITDRTRAQEALAAANQAKDEFLAMLGHELRNPLGTIANAVAVLDHVATDATARRVSEIIGRQTRHLARLVDDLLDVARVSSGKVALQMQVVELRELAMRCVDALAQAGRTGAHHVMIEGEAVHVEGDPARLEQVVANLLDNALKYTPAGGTVAVRLAREGVPTERGVAVLMVRDTGRGIRPALLEHVFDLFVQEPQTLDRSRGGLGIGLTLVKRLVQLHGGTVSASSAGADQGSQFTIRLPSLPRPAPALAGESPEAAPAARRRILVIEDADDARESLRMLLELTGHRVETAVDGPSGLAALRASPPDVALIDVGLPGMDGYAIARAARAAPETRGVLLVAVTGYGQAEDQAQARAAGFDLHLTKPVDPGILARALTVAPPGGRGG